MSDPRTILVIDDEEAIRDSCQQVLNKAGYNCHTGIDGIEGLRLVNQLGPDLVLLDLMMPGIDGLEALKQIRKNHENIVCIVITGYATIESAVEAMKHGAFDFLPKPFTPEELRLIVNRGLEQRRLLEETRELREDKAKMQQYFITIVAHELRSPLLLVKQYLDLIVGGKMGKVDDVAAEMLSGAHSTLHGLLDLIADWLKLARIDAGDITGNLETVKACGIFRKVVEDLSGQAESKGIAIELVPPAEDCILQAHAESLDVVFKNLVSNAIKYNRPGGTVAVRCSKADGQLRIDVADTGIGIPEKELPFIFDDFFRVKSSKTVEIPGSGLGLSIVKKIVEGHRGSLEVESKLDEGTTFTVFLPLEPEAEEEEED